MQLDELALPEAREACTLAPVSIHARIRKKREELGISQAELARRVGVSTQAVQQWEEDDPEKQTAPRRATRKKVAEALGVTLIWLEYGEELPAYLFERQTPPEPLTVREALTFHRVPVIGHAIANPDEDGYFDDMGFPPGGGMDYVAWPTTDPNAYGLMVKGDSMQPRIRPGEIIIVEPGRTPSPGDDVLVKTRAGRKMVKQLLYQRGGEAVLGSINQAHRQLTISLEEIESIQFVGGIIPRSATVGEA
jgi:phage repressor protein C with HTH and peptisase S24 domain